MFDLSPLEWLNAALCVLPLMYVLTCLHELGHAVCGRLAGFLVTSCGMGVSRLAFSVRLAGTRFYVAAGQPMQGVTFAQIPHLLPPRGRMLLFLSGGILAHALLLALTASLLWLVPSGRAVWLPSLALNGFYLLLNLVPLSIKLGPATFRSDGAQMLTTLRDGGADRPPRELVLLAVVLRGLFADLGDALASRIYLVNAAAGWVDLGAPAAARKALDEADAVEVRPPGWLSAFADLARVAVSTAEGDRDAAATALAAAEVRFAELGHAAGLFLCRVRRVDLARDPAEAVALLDGLLADPALATWRYLRPEFEAHRLVRQLELPEADHAALRQRHEGLSRSHPSDARDLCFYLALSRYSAEARPLAQAAAKRLADDWGDEATRETFLAAHAGLLADVPPDPAPAAPAADERERRNRAHRRVGGWLALGTMVAFLVLRPAMEPFDWHDLPLVTAWLVAAVFAIVASALGGTLWLAGLAWAWFRRRGGALVWMLVLVGWLLAAAVYVLPDWDAAPPRLDPKARRLR